MLRTVKKRVDKIESERETVPTFISDFENRKRRPFLSKNKSENTDFKSEISRDVYGMSVGNTLI